jgi:hypothetical protein
MISASVAPLGRFINAITWAFLLERSALGLVAGFLDPVCFVEDLAFLLGLRLGFDRSASDAGVLLFSTVSMLISFLLDATYAVVTFIALTGRNIKQNLRELCGGQAILTQLAGLGPFYGADKNKLETRRRHGAAFRSGIGPHRSPAQVGRTLGPG